MSVRVLITGGLGYLGGRIGQHLASTGRFDVTLGTRGLAAAPVPGFPARVAPMRLDDDESVRQALRGTDFLIHLAALNDVESAADPGRALEVNGKQSLRLVTAAAAAGVRRMIYVSTAHVYGAPLIGTIDERTPARPAHPYASSHRVAEEGVLAAHRRGEIETVAIRLSNGYGAPLWPGVNCWSLVVNDLCRQAVESGRLVLKSSGLQQRNFVPLADVARAIEHLLDLPRGALGDGLFNLGGDVSWSIYETAQRIAARCGAVLGRNVGIERPEPAPGAVPQPLDYRSGKLQATGFRLQASPEAEIDATLRACAGWFGH
jgi:UDP-glucose 4-epimerase